MENLYPQRDLQKGFKFANVIRKIETQTQKKNDFIAVTE
jgi:hypothetical protein